MGHLVRLQAEEVSSFIRSDGALRRFLSVPPNPSGQRCLEFYRDLEGRGEVVALIDESGGRPRGPGFRIDEILGDSSAGREFNHAGPEGTPFEPPGAPGWAQPGLALSRSS